jgi:hypothetical protein
VARSKKSLKDADKTEIAEEAVVVDTEDATNTQAVEGGADPSEMVEHVSDETDADATAEAEMIETDSVFSDVEVEQDVDVDAIEADMTTDTDVQPDLPSQVTQQVIKKRGFVPLLLGGALCVGLGYVGANFLKPEGWPFPGSNANGLQDRISALETAVMGAQAQSDQLADLIDGARKEAAEATASVKQEISDIDLSGAMSPVEAALAAVDQRLTAVEAAPVAQAIVSPEATQAYERQLNEMQALLNSEVARLRDAKAAAENEEANAAKASAVSRLQEAITTGQPYEKVLDDIELDVPDVLRGPASTGVSTLQDIAAAFGKAADVAIVETAKSDTEGQGWMDRFLRTQLGLRSLTPQDGTTPDAVLSRAEQAVRDNDLQTALTEISTLPDVGQAVMADWVAIAQTRLDVTNALSALLAQ